MPQWGPVESHNAPEAEVTMIFLPYVHFYNSALKMLLSRHVARIVSLGGSFSVWGQTYFEYYYTATAC